MGRLYGFNLGNWYSQSDFTPVADLGFNFIRLPIDYSFFEVEPYRYDEVRLCLVDRAISTATKHGLHVLLDLHGAPGYAIGKQDYSLWTDGEKRKRTREIWKYLARRYRDYGEELSFGRPVGRAGIPAGDKGLQAKVSWRSGSGGTGKGVFKRLVHEVQGSARG